MEAVHEKHYLFIIDVSKDREAYRVIEASASIEDEYYDWKFADIVLSKNQVINSLRCSGAMWKNAELHNNDIKIIGSDMSQYNKDEVNLIIISQLENEAGNIVGYKVVSRAGNIVNLKKDKLIEMCDNRTISLKRKIADNDNKYEGINIIQNAIFVSKYINDKIDKSYIKSYPNAGFVVEKFKQKKRKPVENKVQNICEKSKESKNVVDIYNKKQIEQLELGRKNNVDITVYSNPKLEWQKMQIIRETLEGGHDARIIANPELSRATMMFYSMEIGLGHDVSLYMDTDYTIAQLAEISIAYEEGLDISELCNPKLSVREMADKRILMETQMFRRFDAECINTWEQ